MRHTRTQAFEMAYAALDMAKIAAILLWMPLIVLTFLGILISFE